MLNICKCMCLILLANHVSSQAVVSLQNDNLNSVLQRHEVVFVNFYADWCRFSQILTPIFQQAAETIKAEFPQEGKVVFAKVDCDTETDIASTYHISKYPTLKLFRNGEILKKEFRGQRQADSLAQFIRDQLKDSVDEIKNLEEFDEIQDKHRRVVGYFHSIDSDTYRTFAKVAGQLRENCQFHAAFGSISQNERTAGDKIVYRPPNTRREDQQYMGDLHNFDMIVNWATDRCIPLVREITFENAEELTEEGLPFLILFHKPEDTESVDIFNREVARQLMSERTSINCLTADGNQFSHPLHHLGKSMTDLPILAIDSFRHMYLFDHPISDLAKPGMLRQFILDLHSGKLHREFHHGPDETTTEEPPPPVDAVPTDELNVDEMEKHNQQQQQQERVERERPKTEPPVSTFKKLRPSEDRYTILRDEL